MTPYFTVAVITFAAFLAGLGIIYALQVCVERSNAPKGRSGYGGTAGYDRGSEVSRFTESTNQLGQGLFDRIDKLRYLIWHSLNHFVLNCPGIECNTLQSQRHGNAPR